MLDAFVNLARHHTDAWALTGSLAIEIHALRLGLTPRIRPLNDLDFVAARFTDVSPSLTNYYHFRHVHANEIPGRLMVQLVDVQAKLRIDLFRSVPGTMSRLQRVTLPTGEARIVAVEDLVARMARICLDLADDVPVPAKHAEDFLRLSGVVAPAEIQLAWAVHRKSEHPPAYATVQDLLFELIPNRRDLLCVPEYSKDVGERCPKCIATPGFPLIDPSIMLSALGYC